MNDKDYKNNSESIPENTNMRENYVEVEQQIDYIEQDECVQGDCPVEEVNVADDVEQNISVDKNEEMKEDNKASSVNFKPAKKNNKVAFFGIAIAILIIIALLLGALSSAFKSKKPIDDKADVNNSISENSQDKDVSKNDDAAKKSIVNSNANVDLTGLRTIPDIVELYQNSIVAITTEKLTRDFFSNDISVPTLGAGVVFKISGDDIYIVTNNHVVDSNQELLVSFGGDTQIVAKMIGRDSDTDLAVIKVSKSEVHKAGVDVSAINPVLFADSDSIRVGEFVIAMGNPLGYNKTVTFGVVSGLDRTTNLTGDRLPLIQTDAAINPGNSGGALINLDGKLVGINTQKISTTAAESIGFSIPSNKVQEIVTSLLENGYVSKPFLGISGSDITKQIANSYGMPEGVLVRSVVEDSAAQKAGIQMNDIIVGVDGKNIFSMKELSDIIASKKIGDTIKVRLIREEEGTKTVIAKLQDISNNK